MKFCFEGMEESGSEGLDDLLMARKDTEFMQNVDYVCISDNYWLGKEKPCITYGLRGVCYFFIEVECSAADLHSGVFGGSVHEGMADLIAMMNTLVDKDGKILVDGIQDDVAPVTAGTYTKIYLYFTNNMEGLYYALQITFRLSLVQIVNFLCPIDEISVIRASIEHKKLTI
jgi:acetylornithine deacetylase/succinyl-diaminopimelate desuccinylase-like protein